MKITVFVLACVIGYVMCESCLAPSDCSTTSCNSGYDLHCVDSNCLCLSPATGASCTRDEDCESANHGHEHCQFDGDKVWECVQDSCRCVQD